MQKGFTLIELLVVVLIIGILSAVALPQYQVAVEKSRASEAMALLGSLQRGLDLYILESGFPPSKMNFTGTSKNASLDIEITCEREEGDMCYSHNFAYYVMCDSIQCIATADRIQKGSDGFTLYELGLTRFPNSTSWMRWWSTRDSLGIKIGKSLEAFGWEER